MALEHVMSAHTSTASRDRAPATGAREAVACGAFCSVQDLWAYKRAHQRQDLEHLEAGRATEDQMSWFSGGRARACRLIGSPY